MKIEHFGGLAVAALFMALCGACVADCAYATRQSVESTIVDKRHVPGHYREQCDTDYVEMGEVSIPITSCHNVWVAPTWSVRYDDSESYPRWVYVNEGQYNAMPMGKRVRVAFDVGYYTGIRYSEMFIDWQPVVEK